MQLRNDVLRVNVPSEEMIFTKALKIESELRGLSHKSEALEFLASEQPVKSKKQPKTNSSKNASFRPIL